jgi:hypothetical protein
MRSDLLNGSGNNINTINLCCDVNIRIEA